MTATAALTTDLQRQVLLLEDDLRARLQADTEREGHWKQEHQHALGKERTAATWVTWRDDRITQAAVAWVLTTVFIRFCEDNRLVAPVWISGPKERRQEALDAQLAFLRKEEHKEHKGFCPTLTLGRGFRPFGDEHPLRVNQKPHRCTQRAKSGSGEERSRPPEMFSDAR